jgi:hypothetical protein
MKILTVSHSDEVTVVALNRPRREDGSFTEDECDFCGNKSTGYIEITFSNLERLIICKGCLSVWSDMIDDTIIKDCILKGTWQEWTRRKNVSGSG